LEAAKLRDWDTVSIRFPCGGSALFQMAELKKAVEYGSWAPICKLKCVKAYGLDAILKCDVLRAALPLRDFETAISWRGMK
jgi:hypothetical protein